MSLGAGTWEAQNKALPGTYINFTSLAKASAALSERGVAAAPFALSWGVENTVVKVTAEEFFKNSLTLFGYDYTHANLVCLRELFKHATVCYCYRLGAGSSAQVSEQSAKAACTYADAKYPGVRGNDLKIVIQANVDDSEKFDVATYLGAKCVDTQTVSATTGLVDNDFVSFKTTSTLAATAGTVLTGGKDATLSGDSYQKFLNAVEMYSFNALCCPVLSDSTTLSLFTAFTKRMRDERGIKFQTVMSGYSGTSPDYEGIIRIGYPDAVGFLSVDGLLDERTYWMTGAQAGVAVNDTLTNFAYDGEIDASPITLESELEEAIFTGKVVFHKVGDEIRVLRDINSLTTVTAEKGEDFKSNQTIRVCDQIATDLAALFGNQYSGKVPNDESGRESLWNDAVKLLKSLAEKRAIQNFEPDIVSVSAGDTKKAVVLNIAGLNIVNAMEQLYMSVVIS